MPLRVTFFTGVAPTIDQFSYLVFATHGVYRPNIPGIMEPVLAMTMVPPGTDGMLRMTEVMSLKLKADLVALAACETGVGQNISGEGVASMGRAFQYAGARSVLMTLWSVEEKASTTLVSVFFRNLIAGKTKRQALKIARSEIRSEGTSTRSFGLHSSWWVPGSDRAVRRSKKRTRIKS